MLDMLLIGFSGEAVFCSSCISELVSFPPHPTLPDDYGLAAAIASTPAMSVACIQVVTTSAGTCGLLRPISPVSH